MTSYLFLTLGGMLFGAMIVRYDMHEREPWWMLLLGVLMGAVVMAGAFGLEYALLQAISHSGLHYPHDFIYALMAGTLEEAAKLAVPLGVLLLVRRHFNDPMDGLIYGSMAGLGAALYEAVWFKLFASANASASLVMQHGPNAVRLLMHTVWAGVAGFSLGLIVMKQPWRKRLAWSLLGVMTLHFAWDLFVAFPQPQRLHHRLLAALIVGISVIWFGLCVFRANKWSRQMFAPTSKQRLVGKIVRALIFKKFR